ncbi:major facilitator superfamily transporter [Colletotrichum sublineola]|uniref:Putative major facilitator superfamily transporter n=1 Tax=Colletotrichum sublineola TaxID=1173701 RepID=A0A066X9G6_COLSU|nr:major facilitator superfamily transporter [Colletotrichum sublineola]KDN65587.1 putative major facilitator superfamily transporter [Colletotrichum sublineola]
MERNSFDRAIDFNVPISEEKDVEIVFTHNISPNELDSEKGFSTSGVVSSDSYNTDSDSSSVSSSPEKSGMSKARSIALVTTVSGASFMNTLSVQAVVIILPTIGRDIGIPESRLQWIVSAYSLAFGCFLLLWGRIADIYDKRIIFIAGTAWLAIMTLVNPFVPNEIAFNVFRGLQGLGAAANVPTAIGILGTTFPPGKTKTYAFVAYGAGVPLGSVFGTILSGFIAQYANWKWVFGVMALLAAFVAIAGFFFIPPVVPTPEEKGASASASAGKSVDWIGGGLITIGLLALMLALTEGNVVGWTTPWITILIVASLIVISLFWFWQRYLEFQTDRLPLMKTSIFHSGKFCAALAIMGLFFASFNNFLIFATYFYQDYQAKSILTTTLYFLPTGIGGIFVAWAAAMLISRVPTYLLLVCGHVSVSIACLLFATPIPTDTSYFAYGLPAMVLSVIGADMAWPTLILFVSKALSQEDQALGGALVNSVGQVGRSIGLAISTAVQTAIMAKARGVSVEKAGPVEEWDQPSLDGLRAANWMNFALGITSLVIVVLFFRSTEIVGQAEATPNKDSVDDGAVTTTIELDLEKSEKS